jgi:hypothetical protein
MAQPLRTNVRFSPSEGITQLVLSREARVYNCVVGPGVPSLLRRVAMCSCFALRFDGPDDGLWQANRWGVKAKLPVFDIGCPLCCVTRVLSGSAFYGGAYELVADSEPQPYAAAGSRRY